MGSEPNTTWTIPLQDAGDGSGGQILELPDELLALAGWKVGDTLSFEDRGDGTLLVCKVSDEDADLLTIAIERLTDGTEPVPTNLDEL